MTFRFHCIATVDARHRAMERRAAASRAEKAVKT